MSKSKNLLLGLLASATTMFTSCDKTDPAPINNGGGTVSKIDTVEVVKEINGQLNISETRMADNPNNPSETIIYPSDFTLGSSLRLVKGTTDAIVTFENGTDENLTTTNTGPSDVEGWSNYRFDVKAGKSALITNIVPGNGAKNFGLIKDAQGNTIIKTEGQRRWVEVIKAYKGNSSSILLNRARPGFDPLSVFDGATKIQTGSTGKLDTPQYNIF